MRADIFINKPYKSDFFFIFDIFVRLITFQNSTIFKIFYIYSIEIYFKKGDYLMHWRRYPYLLARFGETGK